MDLVAEKFCARIQLDEVTGCWNWKGGIDSKGYGAFYNNGKTVLAHRFAYETNKATIPTGLVLDHLCRNTKCVNPEHLEAVTDKINILRGIGPTAINIQKTFCPQGHELKEPNLVKNHLKYGYRTCKICKNIANYNYRRRKGLVKK